jgi:hypothetical protein
MKQTDTGQVRKASVKWIRNLAIIALAILAGFIYFRFYFVLSRGVESGRLDYTVYRGYVFKTYEGKLIRDAATVQPSEFEFSVADKAVADSLMLSGGKDVKLRYREYLRSLPWRGQSKHIVYEIVHTDR